MQVPYVSSKSLWIGFDNVRSVTLKVKIKMKYIYRLIYKGFLL